MKVVILAGGFGTRLAEYTDLIPKPMVEVGGKPLLWHIMSSYAKYGYNDFIIALGYKSNYIKNYFLNYRNLPSNIQINLGSNTRYFEKKDNNLPDWSIQLVETGLKTATGGRIKKLKKFLKDDNFLLTYGDGLCNVNIQKLVKFHINHNKLVTLTAVRPPTRFGEIQLKEDKVTSFKEKPQINTGWINGGFFVIKKEFIDYIDGYSSMLERSPMVKAVKNNQLRAYKHNGFWRCVDNIRDLNYLKDIYAKKKKIWL